MPRRDPSATVSRSASPPWIAGRNTRSRTRNSRSRDTGFSRKSVAPTFMASTASATLPRPEITTTGVPGAWRCSSRSTSIPVPSGSLRSSSTSAGRIVREHAQAVADGGGGGGLVPARHEEVDAGLAHGLVVVDDEDRSQRRIQHGGGRMLPCCRGPKAMKMPRTRRPLLRVLAACLFAAACDDYHLDGPVDPEPLVPAADGLGHHRVPPAQRMRRGLAALRGQRGLLRELDAARRGVLPAAAGRAVPLARDGHQRAGQLPAAGTAARGR